MIADQAEMEVERVCVCVGRVRVSVCLCVWSRSVVYEWVDEGWVAGVKYKEIDGEEEFRNRVVKVCGYTMNFLFFR